MVLWYDFILHYNLCKTFNMKYNQQNGWFSFCHTNPTIFCKFALFWLNRWRHNMGIYRKMTLSAVKWRHYVGFSPKSQDMFLSLILSCGVNRKSFASFKGVEGVTATFLWIAHFLWKFLSTAVFITVAQCLRGYIFSYITFTYEVSI